MGETVHYITNEEVAQVLFKVASMLELVHESRYRVGAYRRAALQVLFLPKQLVEYVEADEPAPLVGVGERMRAHIVEILNTGHIGVYENLLAEVGEPLASLMRFRGVGPKTAIRLMRELQMHSIDDLVQAARDGRIESLRGFGPKRQANLLSQAEAVAA